MKNKLWVMLCIFLFQGILFAQTRTLPFEVRLSIYLDRKEDPGFSVALCAIQPGFGQLVYGDQLFGVLLIGVETVSLVNMGKDKIDVGVGIAISFILRMVSMMEMDGYIKDYNIKLRQSLNITTADILEENGLSAYRDQIERFQFK